MIKFGLIWIWFVWFTRIVEKWKPCQNFSYNMLIMVAVSRITPLGDLHITVWNPEVINVYSDMKCHMEYLHNERKPDLCYTPMSEMSSGLLCTCLNMWSLEKKFINIAEKNHSILGSYVCILAETRLTSCYGSDQYQFQGFQTLWKIIQKWNIAKRTLHGHIGYVTNLCRIIKQCWSSSVNVLKYGFMYTEWHLSSPTCQCSFITAR